MRHKTLRIIGIVVVVFITYLILDYINIPSLIGVEFENLNVDLLGVIFDMTIVVILYVISFYYIDNKQNEKDDNARGAANVLIKNTFRECFDNLILLDDRAMIEKYIIPKVDGSKPDSENKVICNLQTLPFESLESVISLASSGYVEQTTFEEYLEIKKKYQDLVSLKITFFDLVKPETGLQHAMYDNIQQRDVELKTMLRKYLN